MGRFLLILNRMLQKRMNVFMSITAIALFSIGCTQARANNIKTDLNAWVSNLLTPSKTTLEKAESGYSIKGNLKNKPENLLMLWELTPQNLVFIDSIRTDKSGNFELKGNVKEPLFCQLQWGEQSAIFMVLDNKTQAKLQIDAGDGSFSVEGKGIEGITELKELMDLNSSFGNQLGSIQSQAGNLPKTQEGYEQGIRLQADYNKLLEDRAKSITELAMSKKKSLVPYFILSFGVIESPDISLMEHAVNEAKAYNPNSKYYKELLARYETEKVLAIGAVAPEINLQQPNGEYLALSSLRGKVVLIDFWASWCGPCRRENPFNTIMYKEYHPKGFEIYGVSLDDNKDRWKAAIATDSLVWNHVSDLKKWSSTVVPMYQVTGIPQTFLLDEDGKIIAKGLRGEALEAKLAEHFSKK
jgi:thiol-disulfide isomerase/thioredoxin